MNIIALTFNSLEAREENTHNKAHDFLVKFTPELKLDSNATYAIALQHLAMTTSWYTIRPEYNNDTVKISKDSGSTWETFTFAPGIYDYEDLNDTLKRKYGEEKIKIFFNSATFRTLITLDGGYQLDFREGDFRKLLGFDAGILSASAYGPTVPNLTNSIDNIQIRCSLVNSALVNGKSSNVLFSFPTNTKIRAMPFELSPKPDYFWHKLNQNHISEVRFWVTDELNRPLDLNEQDITVMIVIKKID